MPPRKKVLLEITSDKSDKRDITDIKALIEIIEMARDVKK